MKKVVWLGLCILLLLINIWMGITVRNLRKYPFLGKIFVDGGSETISLPYKESLLTLIVYFSHRSCNECMDEAKWWNKLFMDLPSSELSVVGIVPGNEEIESIKNKYKISFPVFYDKNLFIARSLLISATPLRFIIDKQGRLLYRAPTNNIQNSHEDFYFTVVEILRKIKQENAIRKGRIDLDIF